MINCQNSETYFSSFYDKELAAETAADLSKHLDDCGSCQTAFDAYEKAMGSMSDLNFAMNIDTLQVPMDFTQNVMARVRVAQLEDISAGSWKRRAIGFAAIFLAYAFYMISVSPVNQSVEASLDMTRAMAIYNLLLVGLSLSFIFFTREFVGLNSKVLGRLSSSYQRATSGDVNLLRMVGASIFMGVLIGKFIF